MRTRHALDRDGPRLVMVGVHGVGNAHICWVRSTVATQAGRQYSRSPTAPRAPFW